LDRVHSNVLLSILISVSGRKSQSSLDAREEPSSLGSSEVDSSLGSPLLSIFHGERLLAEGGFSSEDGSSSSSSGSSGSRLSRDGTEERKSNERRSGRVLSFATRLRRTETRTHYPPPSSGSISTEISSLGSGN